VKRTPQWWHIEDNGAAIEFCSRGPIDANKHIDRQGPHLPGSSAIGPFASKKAAERARDRLKQEGFFESLDHNRQHELFILMDEKAKLDRQWTARLEKALRGRT
jgi:hypothetical protein